MFEWQENMSVGIREIDSHHKRIIALINKLEASLGKGEDQAITAEILTEVSNYTIYHFFAEESLMEKHGYPGYEQHKSEHLKLTGITFDFMGKLSGNKTSLGQELLDFLINWLKDHILVTDMKYAPFFHDKGLT